jgi:nucleoside-diphosphate-sugar epimerase
VAARGGCHIVHISSSAVKSAANDWYTTSKSAQEKMVVASGNPVVVLRPTLMFGWFDRKHLGWLARFMKRVPVFPIPGDGRYLRQPLYAGDFCEIIMACLDRRLSGTACNITGLERIDFIDLMRSVREAVNARTPIVQVPYSLFWLMLKAYALVDRNPPFTTSQLRALVTPDIFEVEDWPGMFGVSATPLREALHETFRDPRYSSIALEF